MFALAMPPALGAPGEYPLPAPSSAAKASADAQQQPSVYGVFQNYSWQIYAGYSFFRFYIASKPDIIENMNGLDLGIVFYPHGGWIGVEGQFAGEFGSLFGDSSRFALGLGGARFRWSAPRGIEVWIHGMGGGAHFVPQTAFGGQSAWAYEVGGGLDLGSHRSRLVYRVEADLVGTRFFGTYQDSPRIAAGIVYKY